MPDKVSVEAADPASASRPGPLHVITLAPPLLAAGLRLPVHRQGFGGPGKQQRHHDGCHDREQRGDPRVPCITGIVEQRGPALGREGGVGASAILQRTA